jgi:LysR family transcriptional regulator, glycine cleavage system transcriptional activator
MLRGAMNRRLPPLNALRTFEAAARHLSFTKAADELFVTQAAVSHQIRALEEHLGAPLFRRMSRALILTEQGQVLLPAVRDAFDRLSAGVRRVQDLCRGGALMISTTPSFAASWLAGRLARFHALHPDIELQLSATPRLVEFAREGIDCGIRYGTGDWPGLVSWRLFRTALVPVCSPMLLDGAHPLRRPEHLAQHVLLHALDDPDDWRLWLRAAGVGGIDPTRGLKFDSVPLVVQAAISGAGVGIGRRQLVEGELAAGRLVAPFDLELPDQFAYYFVAPEAAAEQPKLAAFRTWILAEVASSSSPDDAISSKSAGEEQRAARRAPVPGAAELSRAAGRS